MKHLPSSLRTFEDQIKALTWPCVNLTSVSGTDVKHSIGSKFGGIPCLDAGFEWPTTQKGASLTFIGQLNFREVSDSLAAKGMKAPAEMPKSGLLMFFYDFDALPEGWNFKEQDHWRLIWVNRPEKVKLRKSVPEQEYPPRPFRLEPSEGLSWPTSDDARYPLGLSLQQMDDFQKFCRSFAAPRLHRILGYADSIQHDPCLEANIASRHVDPMEEPYYGPLSVMLRQTRTEWRLLWQIDTDDAPESPNFIWGDAGIVYIMIRDEDLRAGRFDNLWMLMQCT